MYHYHTHHYHAYGYDSAPYSHKAHGGYDHSHAPSYTSHKAACSTHGHEPVYTNTEAAHKTGGYGHGHSTNHYHGWPYYDY